MWYDVLLSILRRVHIQNEALHFNQKGTWWLVVSGALWFFKPLGDNTEWSQVDGSSLSKSNQAIYQFYLVMSCIWVWQELKL